MGELDDISAYIQNLESELQVTKAQANQLQAQMSQSQFQSKQDPNLIQYQIDSSDMLSRIEHFLKGDVAKIDDQGNEYYEAPEEDDLILLNEYGINSIMNILSFYIDKNTMLSFYHEERINEILADLGFKLIDFIYCNYERMGLTTEYKKSRFPIMVVNILHAVESVYRRALLGKEREEINSSRLLTQVDHLGQRPGMPMMLSKKKFNLFNPKTW